MSATITWLSHASFRLAAAGGPIVYIDPWKIDWKPRDGDAVFISHPHFDHCSSEDIAAVSGAAAVLLRPAGTELDVSAEHVLAPGDRRTLAGVTIETVAAYNVGKDFHPKANGWLGAVFSLGDVRVYYAGDTDVIPEMAKLAEIDVALVPIGGTYTMTAQEAAQACEVIGPKSAIPCHWGDIVGTAADAEAFRAAASCKVHILRPGQSLTV